MRGEGVRDLVALLQHLTRVRLAGDRALDRELRRFVIEVLDLLVVARFPMDEDADADEEVVGFGDRDGAVLDAIGDGRGDAALRRTEHLHRLLGVLDGDLVEHHGARLAHQVGTDDREQSVDAFALTGERVAERSLRRAAARADDQVDVGDFVAVSDQGFTDHNLGDFGHDITPFCVCGGHVSAEPWLPCARESSASISPQARASKLATVRSAELPGLRPRDFSPASNATRSATTRSSRAPPSRRAASATAALRTRSATYAP